MDVSDYDGRTPLHLAAAECTKSVSHFCCTSAMSTLNRQTDGVSPPSLRLSVGSTNKWRQYSNCGLQGPATRSLVRRDNSCSVPFSIRKKKKSEIRKLDSVS